jgi:hypothetical protein
MRVRPSSLLIPLVVAALAVGVAVVHNAASEPEASCDAADASRDKGLLRQAQKGYAEILADEPSSECATAGATEVSRRLCARAAQVSIGGAPEQATKIYLGVLAEQWPAAIPSCALDGLSDIHRPAQAAFTGPR